MVLVAVKVTKKWVEMVLCIVSLVLYGFLPTPLSAAPIWASSFYLCIHFLEMCKPIMSQGPSLFLASQLLTKSLEAVGQKRLTNAQTHNIITSITPQHNATFLGNNKKKKRLNGETLTSRYTNHKFLKVCLNFTNHVCDESCLDLTLLSVKERRMVSAICKYSVCLL